jgi:hypothetical protein
MAQPFLSRGGVVKAMKIWALCAALSFTSAALAQPAAQIAPQPPSQDGKGTAIASIVVAEIDSLPKEVRKEVDAQISRMTKGEVDALRHSLSIMPAASVALNAKGKRVTDVVAAALAPDGALLLVTTTEV